MKLPVVFQRLEGLVIFLGSVFVFQLRSDNWLAFVGIFLLIDISMAGYLVNNKVGAFLYNIGHTYILPSLIYLAARVTDNSSLTILALIWFAHISMDRALGYGLKEDTGFNDTHLGRIGRSKRTPVKK